MKLVRFNRAMAPYVAGETRLVPDDTAARLAAEGVIDADPPQWPLGSKPSVPSVPPVEAKPDQSRKPRFLRGRDLLGQTYLTK